MRKAAISVCVFTLAALGPAVTVAAAPQKETTQDSAKAAALATSIAAAVKQIVTANPKMEAAALQALVEQALEQQFTSSQPTAGQALAALNLAEASLKAEGIFTAPVAAAFVTGRTAAAALVDLGPAAGPGGGGTPVGAPPAISGGGGSQTAVYATPQ
jgi:hypothetical protein